MKTQYTKIISFYENAEWCCQTVFWNAYIRSPHKRRSDMIKMGYKFEDRPCEHGLSRSKDYKMIRIEPVQQTMFSNYQAVKKAY